MSDGFVVQVREGIARLRNADTKYRVFGAGSHRYEFRPTMSDAELTGFEEAHGVRLPEDYRAFLTQLGNGGAGPSYGIFPLQGQASEDYTDYSALGHPFAYQAAYNPVGAIGEDGEQEEYWHSFDFSGALFICHHGCAARSLLIVSGPRRGQVWADGLAEEHGLYPETSADNEPHTFGSWYLSWLNSALEKRKAVLRTSREPKVRKEDRTSSLPVPRQQVRLRGREQDGIGVMGL